MPSCLRASGSIKLLIIACVVAACSACAKKLPEPEGFFPNYHGPQIAVAPTVVRLGISTMLKTDIVIAGTGFQPGDTVFVDLLGMQKQSPLKIPISSTGVDGNGTFTLVVDQYVKKANILKLDTDADSTPVVVRDPIPEGKYYFKATSVNSDRKAECLIQFDPASKMDKLKDRISSWFGKIRIES